MSTNLDPLPVITESVDQSNTTSTVVSNEIDTSVVSQPPAKKAKKERDPNQPKKPLNNYFLFQRDFRARFKESHPTATSAELSKMMNEAWDNMKVEEKDYYEKLAKEHAANYAKALDEYNKKKNAEGMTESMSVEGMNESMSEANEAVTAATAAAAIYDNFDSIALPVVTDIPMTSSDAETPKKKKKKNKEKREKHSESN